MAKTVDCSGISKRFDARAFPLIILALTTIIVASTTLQSHRSVQAQYASLGVSLPPMNLTLVGLNGTQTTLNEVDIENLPSYESWGGFKNSLGNVGAFGNYTGVPLLTLCNLVGGITANNSLRITAIDNYTAALSYGQVVNGAYITYDNSTRQQVPHNQSLTPILAYYYNGTLLSHDDGSPLRLVIVGPEGLLTDSILWVKWVAKLEVISRAYSDDMAVTNVVPLKTVVGQTFPCSINVTIENQGGYTEIFNGTLNANSTLVATSLNLVLANATFIIIRYNWNTKGIAYGNYTTWAYVQPVPGETNTDNNNSTGGWIEVTIPGDVNGDYRVTLADLVLLANAYGTQVGHDPQGTGLHQWNPNADIDNNGVVGLSDLVTLATHYGQHYP